MTKIIYVWTDKATDNLLNRVLYGIIQLYIEEKTYVSHNLSLLLNNCSTQGKERQKIKYKYQTSLRWIINFFYYEATIQSNLFLPLFSLEL